MTPRVGGADWMLPLRSTCDISMGVCDLIRPRGDVARCGVKMIDGAISWLTYDCLDGGCTAILGMSAERKCVVLGGVVKFNRIRR